jgi:hypothetical protein
VAHLQFPIWKDFADTICTQFGRTEFQSFLRQFNRLQQTGTVVEYTSKFNKLMHNLTAHHNAWEPSFSSPILSMVCNAIFVWQLSCIVLSTSLLPWIWLCCRKKSWSHFGGMLVAWIFRRAPGQFRAQRCLFFPRRQEQRPVPNTEQKSANQWRCPVLLHHQWAKKISWPLSGRIAKRAGSASLLESAGGAIIIVV